MRHVGPIILRVSLPVLPVPSIDEARNSQLYGYDPDMIADILRAISRIERCSLAPSTNLLSTSENTMTILFFCLSGMVSSYTIAR